MAQYIYSGPASGVTLGDREVLLWPGKQYDLPAENEYVQALQERQHLTPVATKAEPKAKKEKA